jgi:hypothetical protein
VDPEARAALDLVGQEDMSRVDPADMSQEDPAAMADTVRVDLASLGARVGQEDMSPEDPVARVDLAERVLTAWERRGQEAQVLNPDRARRDPMPTALDRARPGRMRAHPDPMPAGLDRAHLDPMPADRLWDPTTRAEATRPEVRMRLVEAIPPVEAAPRVEATHRAERPNHRHVCVSRAARNFPDSPV